MSSSSNTERGTTSGLRSAAAAVAEVMQLRDTMTGLCAASVVQEEVEHISAAAAVKLDTMAITEEEEGEERDNTSSTNEDCDLTSTAIEETEGRPATGEYEEFDSSITVEGEVQRTLAVEQREENSAGGDHDTDELDERIQGLPQELQDWIMDLVVADGLPSGFVEIDESYKPPLGLQINHKSRERFAREYYSAGVVHRAHIIAAAHYTSSTLLAYKFVGIWLKALSPPHRDLLKMIRFDARGDVYGPVKGTRFQVTIWLLDEISVAIEIINHRLSCEKEVDDWNRPDRIEIKVRVELTDEGDLIQDMVVRGK